MTIKKKSHWSFLIALVVLGLALGGGMQFYNSPWGLVGLLFGGAAVLAALPLLILRPRPALLPVAVCYLAAMIPSTLANPDIWPTPAIRLGLVTVALAVMVLSHAICERYTVGEVRTGLYLAGLLWPGVWLVSVLGGWWDNPNIASVWPMAFILIGLTGQRWLPLFLNLAVLAILGSRGSLLGLATGGLVIVWPGLRAGFVTKTYIVLGSLTAGGLLIAWKLRTALHRLHYWQQAGAAFLATPVFGVGPGGIKARQVITEPGGGFQVHAHNLLVSSTAELGLVGLVLLALGGWWLYRHRSSFLIHRWQLAILAGLLAHSMVDEPLWWPGPLLLAALVVGSVKVG